jgi:Tol biopolymer transport system component
VDPDTGQPQGGPRRLTNWTGFKQSNLTASADGKRLVFQQMQTVDTVKIAELHDGGRQLGSARPLNSETWESRAAGWTHDAKSILFTATVYGKTGIFRQETSGSNAWVLVSGASGYGAPVITPDGQFLLYTEYLDNGSARLVRAPLEGGPASVLVTGNYGYRCALPPSKFCVMSELQGMQLVFWMLDPFNGRGRELARLPLKPSLNGLIPDWDLSPDAKHIALVDNMGSDDEVRILGLEGASSFSLHLKGWNILQYVNWSADGRHLYVSGGVLLSDQLGKWAILETDLAGDFKVLTELPPSQGWISNPLPSPNGRYLIYNENTQPASVMMLENF